MRIIKNLAAQGDVIFQRMTDLPRGVVAAPESDVVTVAHSETGHHHSIHRGEARLFQRAEADPMICYLQITGEYADVVHHRPWDTHETVRLTAGIWKVRRQREYTPEGYRRVED
jgi:hypothetical protein